MNLRFWRPVAGRRVAKPRLMVTGGFLSLALIVGALIVGVLFTQPAAAASKSPKVAATNGTPIPRLEAVTNVGGQVEHQWSDDNGATWHELISVGALPNVSAVGTPAAVSDGTGRLNLFSRDNNNGLWQKIENNGQWSGWNPVPGAESRSVEIDCGPSFPIGYPCLYDLISDPVVTSWGPGRMDVFVYASNSDGGISLIHTWADNSQWSHTWEDLGSGLLQGTPTAVSWAPGRIDVFVRGGGNELDHKWFDNDSWSSGWENLGGFITSSPAVASPRSGLLNVFARGSEGHLWNISFAFDSGWSGWSDVGCCLAGDVNSSVAAVSPGLNIVDVFVIGTDHALYRKVDDLTAGWADWQFLNHAIDYTNIATTAWFLGAPPPPPTPTPTPKPSPTPVPKPPKCGTPGQPPCPLPQ